MSPPYSFPINNLALLFKNMRSNKEATIIVIRVTTPIMCRTTKRKETIKMETAEKNTPLTKK